MQETGIHRYWMDSGPLFVDDGKAGQNEQNIRNLTLIDLKSTFFLWMIGVGVSVTALIAEIIVRLLHIDQKVYQLKNTYFSNLKSYFERFRRFGCFIKLK